MGNVNIIDAALTVSMAAMIIWGSPVIATSPRFKVLIDAVLPILTNPRIGALITLLRGAVQAIPKAGRAARGGLFG